tara:strand:- start:14826 stop:15119 length:294 start_codon:yes stop_codon:yes gene_type:complete
MGTHELDDTILTKSSLYYDRRCPKCAWVLPKGWHVIKCPRCRIDLRGVKIPVTRLTRRCPHCNKAMPNLRETFCRHCLMNVEINSSMEAQWFDGDGL